MVAIGNTVSLQTGLLKEQDGGFKTEKKKLDNFQRRNLKCNKSAGETTKRKTVMDYQDGGIPCESSQKNMNMW